MNIDFEHEPQINVLVVEDNEADLFLLKRRISSILPNCEVIAAESLQDAYNYYCKNSVDLILLDLNLPDGYGPNTVREVRRFNRVVPIIVVTGLGNSVTIVEAIRNGASDVVFKASVPGDDFAEALQRSCVQKMEARA